jgi:hypothetical protein
LNRHRQQLAGQTNLPANMSSMIRDFYTRSCDVEQCADVQRDALFVLNYTSTQRQYFLRLRYNYFNMLNTDDQFHRGSQHRANTIEKARK